MDHYTTLYLLFFGFSFGSCSRFPLRTYYYITEEMNWTDAQHYCREKYTDLATIESQDDLRRIKPASSTALSWIGLHDDPKSWKEAMGNDANSWRWSETGETSKTGYQNWTLGDPQSKSANENCVLMIPNGRWSDYPCNTVRPFVCSNGTEQNRKTYVYVSSWKTWSSAQAYCREHHVDLTVIESAEDNSQVYSAKPGAVDVWIGLYRVPWTWSDGSQSTFRSWANGQPNNSALKEYCVSDDPKNGWSDWSCDENQTFSCHQDVVVSKKTVVRMKITSTADLTDPSVNTQILQKLGAQLKRLGWTDVKLQWRIRPKKQ